MLSRTAENLFWMARDMERAENIARMLDVSFRMALLTDFVASNNALGVQIQDDFLMTPASIAGAA